MNKALREACQTCSGPSFGGVCRRTAACLLAIGLLWSGVRPAGGQPPTPMPLAAALPPPWQQELDAAHLLEASLLVAPPKDPAEAAARDARMSRLYEELATKYPDRAAVQKARGAYAWHHEHEAEAIAALRRAETLDPADAETADLLASVDVRMGRSRDASTELQRAVRLAPGVARYHFAFANVLYLFRHQLFAPPDLPDDAALLRKSLEEFRRTAELAPHDPEYARAYAETFYMVPQPDWKQARRAWKAVLALSGTSTDFANLHLARVSLRLKRPEEAESYLALIQDPTFADVRAKLHTQAAKLPPTAP